MKNLKNILLSGVFLASACGNSKLLTEKDFEKAEWIYIPNTGEMWTSYMGEDIRKNDANWKIYQEQVAIKNKFDYRRVDAESRYVINFKGDSLLVPDLDKDGSVVYKNKPKEIKQITEQIARKG